MAENRKGEQHEGHRSAVVVWCDRLWLEVLYAIAGIMVGVVAFSWSGWEVPQRLMGLLAIFVPAHVFEENTFPGGFFFMNNLGFGSDEPRVYPQNRLTNMVTNLGAELVFVALTLCAPALPVSCATVVALFGIAETVNHSRAGLKMRLRYEGQGKRTAYGPGSATSYLLLLPLSAYAIGWLATNGWTAGELVAGIGIVLGIVVLLILVPFAISTRIRSRRFAFREIGYFERFER